MPHRIPVTRTAVLRERLDALTESFDIRSISPDPLQLVHRYGDPSDQEVVGLLAAAFAYGRAGIVVRNVSGLLAAMGPSPSRYLGRAGSDSPRFSRTEARRRFHAFSHRFHKVDALVVLLASVSAALARHESLGALFASVYDDRDADIGPSLDRFVTSLIRLGRPRTPADRSALRYLLSSPRDGSACKRMNLYLRWMVRREWPDLGLWTFVDPSKLVMPVDTHVHRICTFLGLNERKSADWKTATELTARLSEFDSRDPVRYDFALCRLGILDLCSRKRRKENCDVCLLRDVCRFPVTG